MMLRLPVAVLDHSIWKNDRLGKSGNPGISQYKFSEMGYPRIT